MNDLSGTSLHCMFDHTLVIGGTGVLRPASVALARQCTVLTSVARTRRSLEALDAMLPPTCTHHRLALDWRQRETFLDALEAHVARVGVPALALLWLHEDALASEIAARIARPERTCRLLQVRGSAAADPTRRGDGIASAMAAHAGVAYRQIVLGFHLDARGSRWLSDQEIADGVLAALDGDHACTVVGTVRPWGRRP